MAAPTVLITGGSDGIGLALARLYAARGARLIVVARRPAPADLPGAVSCRADLGQPYAPAIVAADLARRGVDRLDLLIHCAGVGYYGPAEAQPAASVDELLAVNLRAPIGLTRALLPLLERAGGRLAFISSVAAGLPAPDYAVYGATKAALEGFARSLRVELAGSVGVQVIRPGATRTQMHARSGASPAGLGWSRFPPPERVAAQIARAIDRGGRTSTVGGLNRLLALAGALPGGLLDRLMARRG